MDNVVSFFPLLDLPNKVRMHVLRNMELMQQIGFSLCSERAKSLIKSVNLKIDNVFMHVNRNVQLFVNLGSLLFARIAILAKNHGSWTKEDYQPAIGFDITIRNGNAERTNFRFEKLGYSIKKWIRHIVEIFNHSKINELYLMPGYEYYNIESMKETFKVTGLRRLRMEQVVSNQAFYEVLRTFPPTKQLCLSAEINQHPESIQRFLNQNFDVLILSSPTQVTLNDLLIINSLEVDIYHSILTEKDSNTFLKLWINGSNPRLRYLFFYHHWTNAKRNLDEKKLLNGIKYQVVPNKNKRVFKAIGRYSDVPLIWKVNSGFDIKRNDGTVATIQTRSDDICYSFKMFVWN